MNLNEIGYFSFGLAGGSTLASLCSITSGPAPWWTFGLFVAATMLTGFTLLAAHFKVVRR